MKQILGLIIVSAMLVPEQVAAGPTLPVGTMPWALPELPIINIDFGLGAATFDEVQHSPTYDAFIEQIEAQNTTGLVITGDAETGVDEWIGPEGVLPNTGANFETGIVVPGYEDTDAEAVATELGSNIGELLARIRGLAAIDMQVNTITVALAVIILCLCWLLFLQVIKFALRFVDMVVSVVVRIIELIPGVE